ncbi:succinyl-diaminopimelate desuccinylase [Thiorhodospira sibirica]|uniref:succinyl-diaminopimelate desuccinylase n=1 Tax=Thiorhodospira sibirica TaxID=154347 RepID=UPI00022C597C|nr:succinyl-diaminopimelate desuccinylase [Thiorhodospira sibirica]
MSVSATLELACELIARHSVTPQDAGCQALVAERLAPYGFVAQPMRFGEVDNLWLRRGTEGPLFVFAGHTDVVPSGPVDLWSSDPFTPTVRDGYLYGRGAADMKGAVAAVVTACEAFVQAHPDHAGSIALLLTSDEEGPAVHGTVKVVEWLKQQKETVDFCLVAEPSCQQQLGDTLKNGRRGSLSGDLVVLGQQGHVAYPHLADNPIHRALPALAELAATVWDEGNEYFPQTTFQIANAHAGTGADNVIPGRFEVQFNLRFSTVHSPEAIQQRIHAILDAHNLDYRLNWRLSGLPFLTEPGRLVEALTQAIEAHTGLQPILSTSGGTSDGRFIATICPQVVEFGPLNATIHRVDECVSVADLEQLSRIYTDVLRQLLVPHAQGL